MTTPVFGWQLSACFPLTLSNITLDHYRLGVLLIMEVVGASSAYSKFSIYYTHCMGFSHVFGFC
jgi:hypothetical protein